MRPGREKNISKSCRQFEGKLDDFYQTPKFNLAPLISRTMAKEIQNKKRKGTHQFLIFMVLLYANFTAASVPEAEADKTKKVKKAVAEAPEVPAKKRKGTLHLLIYQLPVC